MPSLLTRGSASLRNFGFTSRTGATASAEGLPVQTGLQVHLDAGRTVSYPGSGQTWYNLATGGSNWSSATLSPTFNGSSFGGGFSGAGWYWTVDTSVTDTWSYEIWCMPSGTINVWGVGGWSIGGNGFVIAADNRGGETGGGLSVGTNGYTVIQHANSYFYTSASNGITVSSTVPTHFIVTMTSRLPRVYVNGSLNTTGSDLGATVRSSGSRIGYGDYGSFSGTYYIARIYNIALDATQVLTNYNAEKSRFGL